MPLAAVLPGSVFLSLGVAIMEPPPPAIQALMDARRSLAGDISWEISLAKDPDRAMSFRSRYALNGDYIFENRGDRAGWTLFGPDGAGTSKFPQLYMHNRDGFWSAQETDPTVALWRDGGEPSHYVDDFVKDVRGVGLLPWSGNLGGDSGIAKVLDAGPPNTSAEWSEEKLGERIVVVAEFDGGRRVT